MANLQYTSDILEDALHRTGEPVDGSSVMLPIALAYLNRAYRTVYMGGMELLEDSHEDWWWLRKTPPGVLILNPAIETGTLAVTNNSASVTFSSAPASSVAGRFLQVIGHSDMFRISAHTGGQTAATLDSVYTGTTAATATYRVMDLEPTLASDILRLLAPFRAYRSSEFQLAEYRIEGMDLDTLESRYPLREIQSGVPRSFAPISESKIRLSHYGGTSSTDLIRIEYEYLYRPADLANTANEEPVVPRQYRQILSDITAMWLALDKNSEKNQAFGLAAKAGLMSMAKENRSRRSKFSGIRGRITSRPENMNYGLVRTASGNIIG